MDIYATHLPVLKAISKHIPIMNVLELGAGSYSTAMFCSGDFSTLRLVDSYETDKGWYDNLRKVIVFPYLNFVYSPVPLAQVVPTLDLGLYDLIFIDDGHSLQERTDTIVAVTRRLPRGLIVIHDFEQEAYQRAADVSYAWAYTTLTPHTGVLINEPFELLDELIAELDLQKLW